MIQMKRIIRIDDLVVARRRMLIRLHKRFFGGIFKEQSSLKIPPKNRVALCTPREESKKIKKPRTERFGALSRKAMKVLHLIYRLNFLLLGMNIPVNSFFGILRSAVASKHDSSDNNKISNCFHFKSPKEIFYF